MAGREIRLMRLFNRKENAVIIAADHGEFDGPLPGMINIDETMTRVYGGVDGVLLSPGMAQRAAPLCGARSAPCLVIRLNWSSHFCFHWGYDQGASVRVVSAAEAMRLGADAALICLTLATGDEERDARGVELFSALRVECHALGLPVIGECFPRNANRLTPDDLHDYVRCGCRILAELGADAIKTFHTCRFPDVVAGCPVPILALGAEKTATQIDAMRLAQRTIADGGRGVVFGRNALQVPDPLSFQKALCEVVKRGMQPEDAAARFGLRG